MLSMWIMLIMCSVSEAGSHRTPCLSGWKYHEVSRSCLLMVHAARNYHQSHVHCIQLGAHLVFILDKPTDDFVKDLLQVEEVPAALIGLHDRARKGDYMWGDTRMKLAGYVGWESNQRQEDWSRDLSSVVVSRRGWREFNRHQEAPSVCQYQLGNPEKPKCVHSFVDKDVEVKCIAAELFSGVICEMEIYRGNEYLGRTVGQTWTVESMTPEGQPRTNVTGCSASFSPGGPGVFTLKVVLTFTWWASRGVPNTAQSLSVQIIPPEDPPRLYESASNFTESPTQLQTIENTTVSLTCKVQGGTPVVHRTQIDCGHSTHQETPLTEVELVLLVTRHLHGQTCTCRAYHLAGYNQTASLVLQVVEAANNDTDNVSVQERPHKTTPEVDNTTGSLNTSEEWSDNTEKLPARNVSSASVNLNLRTLVTIATVGQIWFVMVVLVVTVFAYYRYSIHRRAVTFIQETQEKPSFCPGYKYQVDCVFYENIVLTGDRFSYESSIKPCPLQTKQLISDSCDLMKQTIGQFYENVLLCGDSPDMESIIKPCPLQTKQLISDSCDLRKQTIGRFYENVLLCGDSPNIETSVTESPQERQPELAVSGAHQTEVTCPFYENVLSIHNTDNSEKPLSPSCTCMCHESAGVLDISVPDEVVYFNTNTPVAALGTHDRGQPTTEHG